MRFLNRLCLAVGVCLWGQALLDQSQVWLAFAVLWVSVLAIWIMCHQVVHHSQTMNREGGDGLGVVSALLAAILAVSLVADRSWSSIHARFAATATVEHENSATSEYRNGHFNVQASIDGIDLDMLVDTGASLVFLKHDDAIKAGIDVETLVFDTPVLTAAGRSHFAVTQIAELRVNDVIVRNVEAAVGMPGHLHKSLLGMTFLTALSEVKIRGDQMIFTK